MLSPTERAVVDIVVVVAEAADEITAEEEVVVKEVVVVAMVDVDLAGIYIIYEAASILNLW